MAGFSDVPKAFETGNLEDLSELALYVPGINRDKVSDLTTNIIREHLVKYTNEQCELLGIPVTEYSGPPIWSSSRQDWISDIVNLPYVDSNPVILVPKAIVRRNFSINSDEFYRKHILTFLQTEHVNAHGSLARLVQGKPSIARVKKGKTQQPTKKKLAQYHPKSSSLIVNIVSEHPELLDYYKKIAADRKEPINIRDDDLSVSRVCLLLADKLKRTNAGKSQANEYHYLCQGIITTVFFPSLVMPRIEWDINDGRKRIDIVYMNDAREGFLQQRRDMVNTAATMLIVECKNYTKDISVLSPTLATDFP